MFLKATILIPVRDKNILFDYHCYDIKGLESPAVQRTLEDVMRHQYLKIANLGLLYIRDVEYTKIGGILITCKKVKTYVKGYEGYDGK